MLEISIPGKIFLLGEYAVLGGSPAWVAALGPRFSLRAEKAEEWEFPFSSQSPAGRLLQAWKEQGEIGPFRFAFRDAHGGAGGFGGSTAEFALAYVAEKLISREAQTGSFDAIALPTWKKYREVTGRDPGIAPSGADLLVQLLGGVQRVRVDRTGEAHVSPIHDQLPLERFVILSAAGVPGRKVTTHAHLASFEGGTQFHRDLEQIVADAEMALHAGDVIALGASLTRYAEVLGELGLEAPAAREERERFTRLPGVLGYKGCGALLSDAAVALVSDDVAASGLIQAASARGLRLVTQGLKVEPGVR